MYEAELGLADSRTKLSIPPAEDLSYGTYRDSVQTECERPYDDVRDDRRGDAPCGR